MTSKYLIALALSTLLLAGCSLIASPQDQAAAQAHLMVAAPTATAAAISNEAEQTRQKIVAPVAATAEAASILARTDQTIKEEAFAQARRHTLEMNMLAVSQTLALNNQALTFESGKQKLIAGTAAEVARSNESAANAVIATARDAGINLLLVISVGLSAIILAVCGYTFLHNRAQVVNVDGERVIMYKNAVVQPSNSLAPVTMLYQEGALLRAVTWLITLWALKDTEEFRAHPWQVIPQVRAALASRASSELPATEGTMLAVRSLHTQKAIALAAAKATAKTPAAAAIAQEAVRHTLTASAVIPSGYQLPTPMFIDDEQTMRAFDAAQDALLQIGE